MRRKEVSLASWVRAFRYLGAAIEKALSQVCVICVYKEDRNERRASLEDLKTQGGLGGEIQ